MAVPNWSPVLPGDLPDHAEAPARHLDRENAALRELVTVYRYLSGLALQDADLAGVVRLISDRTSATVAVLTQLMDVLTAAAPGVSEEKATADVREHLIHPRLGQVLRASRLSQRALRLPKVGGMPAVIVAPVMVGDEVPSYLITIDPADNLFGEDMSLLVTEHAATICGVILGRERVVAAAARRVRDDLVEGLLLGRGRDNADASRWAAHLGYDPARDHNVVAIAFDLPASPAAPEDSAAQRQRIWESIEHFVATRAPEAIVSARESEVVVVTTAPEGHGPNGHGANGHGANGNGPAMDAPALRRLPGPAGRTVPHGQGGHRHRRDLPRPGGDRAVLRAGAAHHPDPAAARPGRNRQGRLGVRRPRHPAAAAPGARPGRVALLRRRRAGQAQHARARAQVGVPDHAGLLLPGEQQPAAGLAHPARAPEHGGLPGQADRGDHRAPSRQLHRPAHRPGGAGDP